MENTSRRIPQERIGSSLRIPQKEHQVDLEWLAKQVQDNQG